MAKIPTTKQITIEELQGSADQKIEALVRPINLFIRDVNQALNQDLTLGDNVDAQIITIAVQTSSAYPTFDAVNFSLTTKHTPYGAHLINIIKDSDTEYVFTSAVWVDVYFPAGESYGTIRHITGLAASTNYTITLLII